MKRDTQRFMARSLGTGAALVMFATLAVMIADYAAARRRAPLDKQRVDELSQLVKEDDAQSPVLEAEWERQTLASLMRAVP